MNKPEQIAPENKKKNFKYLFFLVLLIFILLSKAIFFEFYRVSSISMMNILLPGDFVLINKLVYGANTPNMVTIPFFNFNFDLPSFKLPGFKNIEVGDVIVISKQMPARPDKYIKRCVAVHGQTVEVRNNKILVDDMPVEEFQTSFNEDMTSVFTNKIIKDIPPVVVPEGFIFVLGDNRNLSYDSRSFGFVDAKDVIGKASFIYSSIDGNGDFRWSRFFKTVE
ncbi:MAG: signal peptidase I [Candidatus Delongbacteria bacterium]|nr:signal peptidase I [Candidatus Delongbacteria bacterium]